MTRSNAKPRRFYPRQALRRLQGDHVALSPSQDAALRYLTRRGRRMGYSVTVFPNVCAEALMSAKSEAAFKAILANATTRIILTPAV